MRDQRFGNGNNVEMLCVLGHLLTTFSIWRGIIFYKITTEALLFKKNKSNTVTISLCGSLTGISIHFIHAKVVKERPGQ